MGNSRRKSTEDYASESLLKKEGRRELVLKPRKPSPKKELLEGLQNDWIWINNLREAGGEKTDAAELVQPSSIRLGAELKIIWRW